MKIVFGKADARDNRRKIKLIRETGVTLGSTWVSPSQDPITQLNKLLAKIGAHLSVPYPIKTQEPLPIWLL